MRDMERLKTTASLLLILWLASCNKMDFEIITPDVTTLGIKAPVKKYETSSDGTFNMTYSKENKLMSVTLDKTSKWGIYKWETKQEPLTFIYTYDDREGFIRKDYYQNFILNKNGCATSFEVVMICNGNGLKDETTTKYSMEYDDENRLTSMKSVDSDGLTYVVYYTWSSSGELAEWNKIGKNPDKHQFVYNGLRNTDGLFIELQMGILTQAPFLFFGGLLGSPSSMLPCKDDNDGFEWKIEYNRSSGHVISETSSFYVGGELIDVTNKYGY